MPRKCYTVEEIIAKLRGPDVLLVSGRSRYSREFWPVFKPLNRNNREQLLSRLNFEFIRAVNRMSIGTRLTWSNSYRLIGDRSERLESAQAGRRG